MKEVNIKFASFKATKKNKEFILGLILKNMRGKYERDGEVKVNTKMIEDLTNCFFTGIKSKRVEVVLGSDFFVKQKFKKMNSKEPFFMSQRKYF